MKQKVSPLLGSVASMRNIVESLLEDCEKWQHWESRHSRKWILSDLRTLYTLLDQGRSLTLVMQLADKIIDLYGRVKRFFMPPTNTHPPVQKLLKALEKAYGKFCQATELHQKMITVKDEDGVSSAGDGVASTAELLPEGGGFRLHVNGQPQSNALWYPDEPKNGALKYALANAALAANGALVLYKTLTPQFKQASIRAAAEKLETDFGSVFVRGKVGRQGGIKAIHGAAQVASSR